MRVTEAEYRDLLRRRTHFASVLTGRRWEDEFALQLELAGVDFVREFRFVVGRRYRFDFALPRLMLAVEIDGVVHRIKSRFNADREKGNFAVLGGWRVLHFSPKQVRSGEAISLFRVAIAGASLETSDKRS